MNRSAKWLVVVLAMTVCLTALWGCGEKVDETQTDSADGTTIQLNGPDLPPESSDGMEFCNGSVTLRLIRNENDKWIWKDDASFPLDQVYAEEMLATAQEVLQLSPVEGAGDPSEYYSRIESVAARKEDMQIKHKAFFIALNAINSASDK